ncbi:MAG TPA: hypothetical protein EYN74_08635 [Nitrospirales bacterium]|nr:hypothetical protein [Nitrospirales bacterium]HIN32610.1 hypothetical protein [Nitrospirales bacterium]
MAEQHTGHAQNSIPPPQVIAPPRIRLPIRISKGKVIKVQAKMRHPSRTGIRMIAEHVFAKGEPAFYIKKMEVFFRDALVSTYEMSAALSDDPIVTFKLRASEEGPVRVVFTSSEDKAYEASTMLRFTEG